MSRIAKVPVVLSSGVECKVTADSITLKGKVGEVSTHILPRVNIVQEGSSLKFSAKDDSREANQNSGTMTAIVRSMNKGVSEGYTKTLTLVGVGYRAQAQGNKLNLSLGFSHPVVHEMPAGVVVKTPTPTSIVISGADKQLIGQVAADVRSYRKPEPYKGKGIRYENEVVIIKETKKK
ncbi:50S ribosomal protein L6 [Mesosutterella sp. OilRF-GAM-744-9]|uniref:Large ribosomal subunit protein uL6 n=1 Tax=Mesosutterella porci TaxID=2915351 RepID=A0ABS9MR76_9BURK|nr:50S ribosomal protein L6 [Mesosutterella sp. oilRF-744-WT-GAM-9]MCG5031116.1 50S ribosomal protein L6 [Mesosutterella sp. oilRF-744-WT-GAM-9]MCI6529657.1 50S ribosomal protein L6 [Mesosutterella sp.]